MTFILQGDVSGDLGREDEVQCRGVLQGGDREAGPVGEISPGGGGGGGEGGDRMRLIKYE